MSDSDDETSPQGKKRLNYLPNVHVQACENTNTHTYLPDIAFLEKLNMDF